MPNWRYRINIKDVHDLFDGEESIPTVGKAMAKRLRESKGQFRLGSDQAILEELASQFEKLETVYKYDQLLDTLYNWADAGHKCWINSFEEA